MRKLHLYSRSINEGSDTHYFAEMGNAAKNAAFLAELQPSLIFSFEPSNYRISEGAAIVSAGTLSERQIAKVCYIVETDETGGEVLNCWGYHVRRSYSRSGNIYFDVSRDLWLEAMKGEIGKMHLTRTNRKYGTFGLYEEVYAQGAIDGGVVDGDLMPIGPNGHKTLYPSEVAIVFSLDYVGYARASGEESVSQTKMFFITLDHIVNDFENTAAGLAFTAPELAITQIGGIYGCGAAGTENQARVVDCWLLPRAWIHDSGVTLRVVSKTNITSGKSYDAHMLQPQVSGHAFDFSNADFMSQYPNRCIYVGAKYDGLKWPRYRKNDFYMNASIILSVGASSLSVVIMNGEVQKDITASFECVVTTSSTFFNTQYKIAHSIDSILSPVTTAARAFATSGTAGGVVTTAQQILRMVKETSPTGSKGQGDGLSTWTFGANTYDPDATASFTMKSPICVYGFFVAPPVAVNCRNNGFACDIWLDGISGLASLDALDFDVETNASTATSQTFIKCDFVEMSTQEEAGAFLLSELQRGIYAKLL